VYDLEFNVLFDVQAIFLGKEMTSLDEVHALLDKIGKKE